MMQPSPLDPYLPERAFYPEVYALLRRTYPGHEGWRILPRDDWAVYGPDFVLERRVAGEVERAIVKVMLGPTVSSRDILRLRGYRRAYLGEQGLIQTVLVVPAGTEVYDVPHDIKLVFLPGLSWQEEGLVRHP
jgi:hypothetical protein